MNKSHHLSTEEMLAAIQSCEGLAWMLAKKFHAMNPRVQLSELYAVAQAGLKIAALAYDPTREAQPGVVAKYATMAYFCVRNELIHFCRNESAAGMHVPTDHGPWFAPPAQSIKECWQVPADSTAGPEVNELGDDFWKSVTRTLCRSEREVILRVFRDGLTQKDAAEKLGISRARVGQVYLRAMEKLRRRDDLKELARAVA